MNAKETAYIFYRQVKGALQSIPFYVFRIFPVKKNKIVFTTIEGTTGFSCNPKYIAKEMLRRNKKVLGSDRQDPFEIVWLVDDVNKHFPAGIRKVRNTLLNRAFELTTAKVWIDNSRKQLEARKRRGQIYLQTWHAKLGFKPTCLDRGASFSRIAYLVSKHDSDLIDYWLSNSDWYDRTLKTGSLYEGKTLRSGSPRCDILVKAARDDAFKEIIRRKICERHSIVDSTDAIRFLMYAPTFRGGSQSVNRSLEDVGHMPDFQKLIATLKKRFGGHWIILLRLHPQMTVRGMGDTTASDHLVDISHEDDLYEYLAGCDAFLTDYSSAAFDAAVMQIPVFLYCDDYKDYEGERGKLLWDLKKLPFPLAETDEELQRVIEEFADEAYQASLEVLFAETGMVEDGHASERVVEAISNMIA